jgi:flagellar hook protein FlgE
MISNINSMAAHTAWLANSAHNVANVDTRNFGAVRTTLESGPRAVTEKTTLPTDLSRELPAQAVIEKGFSAQVSAIRTQDDMLGTLLDMKG